jgi:hypothetical protein
VILKYVYIGQGKDEKRIAQFQNGVCDIIFHNFKEVMSVICRYLLPNLVSSLVKHFQRNIHSTLPENPSVFRRRAQLYASISLLEYGRDIMLLPNSGWEIMPTHRCKKPPTIQEYT